jgi:hypothetical protein
MAATPTFGQNEGRKTRARNPAAEKSMASLLTALITLASLCAGTALGSFIRNRLPDHQSHAVTTCIELAHSRWLIIEQAQTTLPTAFLGMLIFWLTVLFASLGLLAPRNATTWCSLFVCAVSMAGAIYLILEMNRPLEGAVQISPAPLQKALSVIGKAGQCREAEGHASD